MRLSFTGEAAFELHHPVRSLGGAVAGADGPRHGPWHPAARAPGALRAAAGEGPRHRGHGHRARHDPAAPGHGLGRAHGEAALHRPGRARTDGQAARRATPLRLHHARTGPDRGQPHPRRRRRRRPRQRQLGVAAPRARRSCSAGRSERRSPTGSRSTAARPIVAPTPVLRPGGPPCPSLEAVRGLRVVADPAAIDGATWTTDVDTPAPVHPLRAGRGLLAGLDLGRHRRRARHRRRGARHRRRLVPRSPTSCRTSIGRCRSSDRPSPRAPSPACRPSSGSCDDTSAVPVHQRGLRARACRSAGLAAMSDYTQLPAPRSAGRTTPKPAYDVVIIGGGGHGLSTAYHLAARHGITNVAVLEADYIASGNTGRNTTIIRANYGLPEADPLLPALARALPAAGGRDRRRHPPPDQGHPVDGPYRDGHAHRARRAAS